MITLEIVDELIETSRPRGGLLRGRNLILMGLAMLFGALLANPGLFGAGTWAWLFPQIVLLVLVVLLVRIFAHQRRLGRLMLEAFESVQLREWPKAHETLERLLRNPLRPPAARTESLLALAAVAEAGDAYDASQRIYESVLDEDDADPLQRHTTQVALAGAMLRNGQLTDAVNLIDRLGRADLPEPLLAQVELLRLFREITMGQTDDAIVRADERRCLFRDHLSTRAGYGYALLAAAFDRAGQPDRAGQFWRDATLLVRPDDILDRFSELKPVAEAYPAARRAL